MTEVANSPDHPLVEVGWILIGRMGDSDLQAAMQTREKMLSYLAEIHPEFEWRMPLTRREELVQELREGPIRLLDFGATERDIRHWDFAILVTEAPLAGNEKTMPWAALSTALGAAVISTAQIDPGPSETASSNEARIAKMSHRIEALALHCLGHLTGLEHGENSASWMFDFQTLEELDQAHRFLQEQLEPMRRSLQQIADQRLEEQSDYEQVSSLSFYVHSARRNRREILQAIKKAEPWLFPMRLSRLAFAAVSALMILLMTAESWELGMSLSPQTVSFLSVICLFVTTGYVTVQQRLLVHHLPNRIREQRVIALVSMPMVVLLGIVTTFFYLFVASLVVELTLFRQSVVESWAASVEQIGFPQYLSLSAYIASVALVVGALGASLEDHRYFRHVALVDEEI